MKDVLDIIGIISSLIFLGYVFFWRTKSVGEVLEDNHQESTKSFAKSVGWVSWLFLIIAAASFFTSWLISN